MRFSVFAIAALGLCFASGCASTVSPLYTKVDAVTDPALVGTWITQKQDEGQNIVHIAPVKDGSYQVTVHDTKSGDDAIYQAHLVGLNGESFADLLLMDYRHEGQSLDLPWGAVALHQIVKYSVAGDDLACSTIDDDALRKSAKQPGFPLQFRDTSGTGGDTVIVSTTDELRHYLSSHPAAIFGNAEHLKRQR
ncbi:MAG TPA: hypothetical protein VGR93_08050 [Candidatus Acidoferrales bacterium]|nr:hypothetical protein [Candidatus Acidoferrales bacterium]